MRRPPRSPLFPCTTLFRSARRAHGPAGACAGAHAAVSRSAGVFQAAGCAPAHAPTAGLKQPSPRPTASRTLGRRNAAPRSEEHTAELQAQSNLVFRLLL